jgi:FAD:protein FMN transferase
MVEIRAASSNPSLQLHAALDAAFATIERIHRLMSYQEPGSDISRINRAAGSGERTVDADTYVVLESALRFAALSDGAFDPCVGTQLERWGFLPRRAARTGPEPALPGTWRDVQLLDHCRVRCARPLRLDLGGIAKGYAVDRAVHTLQVAGVENILVNAGGDLRVAGPWTHRICLRHPQAPQLSANVLSLRDAALATSGAYYSRRRLPSGVVSALLDPRTVRPYVESGSVSVRADSCMNADALTKVVLFATPERAERALSTCDARAFVQPAARQYGLA